MCLWMYVRACVVWRKVQAGNVHSWHRLSMLTVLFDGWANAHSMVKAPVGASGAFRLRVKEGGWCSARGEGRLGAPQHQAVRALSLLQRWWMCSTTLGDRTATRDFSRLDTLLNRRKMAGYRCRDANGLSTCARPPPPLPGRLRSYHTTHCRNAAKAVA